MRTVPANATASPDITLLLAPPTGTDDTVRISSNNGGLWVEMPWAASLPWSLANPAAGGVDEDGLHSIFVQYGNGIDWHESQIVNILLQRAPPVITGIRVEQIAPTSWKALVAIDWTGPTEVDSRISFDGINWQDWGHGAGTNVDLRDGRIGGDWSIAGRQVWAQLRTRSGIEGEIGTATFDLAGTPGWDGDEGKVKVRMEMPRPAITGELFTFKPVYPPGYVLPADAWCEWTLHWGDDAALFGLPNPTWGEIIFERPKSSGACTEWTFTLPYTISRQFKWMFQLYRKDPSQDWGYSKEGLYVSPGSGIQVFHAALGSTDPRITTSKPPIAYILPESTVTQAGDPVTYRLHVAGGTTVPQTGMFWAYPMNCYLNPTLSQKGGSTFTYRPNCNGPWVTGWTGTYKGTYMRSQYDPIADSRPPTPRAPRVAIRGATIGSAVPVTVSWSATDSGSGVYRYQLQISRNGGAWSWITLPSRLTKSIPLALSTSKTYRFRMRARDRVGNWSKWATGLTVSARIAQEGSSSARWSSGWTTVRSSSVSGGAAKTTDAVGASVRFSTTAKALAIVGRRGPGRGLARIYVDGAYVRTIDLGATTLGTTQVLFARSWSTSAPHSVEIRNQGTLSRPTIEADAFLVIR